MHDKNISRFQLKHGVTALLVVGTLIIGGCSTGGSDVSGDATKRTTTSSAKRADKSSTVGEDDGNTKTTSGKINALVPIDAKAADGSRMIRAECEAPKAEPDADGSSERFSPIVYAVPEAWKSRGGGSGGSGSVLGTSYDVNFETASKDRVKVEYDWDSWDDEGRVLGNDRKPWKSFDYDTQVGDSKTRITFDLVATLFVGDQEVDLYYLDPAQAPEHVRSEEYRARVSVLEVSKSKARPADLREYSAVFKVTFDSDAAVTQEEIADVVASVSMPSCTWDEIVEDQELMLQMDVDGDGTFKSQEDFQKEMQEQLAETRKELEAQRRNSDDS